MCTGRRCQLIGEKCLVWFEMERSGLQFAPLLFSFVVPILLLTTDSLTSRFRDFSCRAGPCATYGAADSGQSSEWPAAAGEAFACTHAELWAVGPAGPTASVPGCVGHRDNLRPFTLFISCSCFPLAAYVFSIPSQARKSLHSGSCYCCGASYSKCC
mmetsp:Transcript_17518/g.48398  ORF Transcript_17518/g.48398 Transcript_17518/m.48398 type:complete len:157 (-) Transcript_17518:239-709(-)